MLKIIMFVMLTLVFVGCYQPPLNEYQTELILLHGQQLSKSEKVRRIGEIAAKINTDLDKMMSSAHYRDVTILQQQLILILIALHDENQQTD